MLHIVSLITNDIIILFTFFPIHVYALYNDGEQKHLAFRIDQFVPGMLGLTP